MVDRAVSEVEKVSRGHPRTLELIDGDRGLPMEGSLPTTTSGISPSSSVTA